LFHSVGTGKTFSAINTSQILLRRGIVDRVVVITPTSLQLNFIKQFRDYDTDLQTDTRYQYFTPQQFYLQMAKPAGARRIKAGERMMLVIDEAHHYRTPIFGEKRVRLGRVSISGGDPPAYDRITDYTVSNRVRAIFRFMKSYPVAKVLLLTATPFVNQLYDIENLVAFVENRPPRKVEEVKDMSAFPLCRFHYFTNTDPKYAAEFPRKIIRPLYYVMSKDYYRRYLEIEQGLEIPSELYRGGLNQFYNGVRRAANKLDFEVSDKLAALIDMIGRDQAADPRVRILVYSGWLETGLTAIGSALDERGIRALPITGRLSKARRDIAVQAFNGGEINVLLISKAGGEGLDLKKTNKVYILEPTWNDASTQQIIGRAVRYRSHADLEESKRFVEIYYMLLLKPAEGRVLAAGGENARKLLSDPIAAGKYAPSLIGDDDTRPSIDMYLTWFGRAKQEVLNRSVEELAKRSEQCFSAIGAEVQRELSAYDRRPLERRRACFPAKRVEQSGGINRVIIEEDSCSAPSAIDLGLDEQLTDAELKERISAQIRATLEWSPSESNIIEMRLGSDPAPYDERYHVSRIESVPKPLLGRFSERIGNLPSRKKIQLVAAYDIDRYRRNESAIMLTLFFKDEEREHEIVFL
jgi:superfamily II DNA or RNA helicase